MANEAEKDERPRQSGPGPLPVMLLPMSPVNMVADVVAIHSNAMGPNMVTSAACAPGATAIGAARELLNSGRCDIVIAGGTEAAITPLLVSGFARMGILSTRHDDPAAASRRSPPTVMASSWPRGPTC